MSSKPTISSSLQNKTVAVPESRQLDVLADLFQRRGAQVLRVPMVAILDAPQQEPILRWLEHFIAQPPDFLILLTGEGIRRLYAAAQRAEIDQAFVTALALVIKVCRGPKPGRALKELGLKPDLLGAAPTTAGIITTLQQQDLQGRRMAVQLYGEDPNQALMQFLATRQLAQCSVVAPYVYASDSDSDNVRHLISEMAAGRVDVIAFTSQPQVKRLFDVANKHELLPNLREGMRRTRIAAIGPVVVDILASFNCDTDIMPVKSYFMKPLVTAVETYFTDS